MSQGGSLELATMTPAEIKVHTLLALGVIIVSTRAAGWLISRIGQPRVHGQILAGILLGPSLLGVLWPEALAYLFPLEAIGALGILAQIGVVLFMFLIGLELDLESFRRHGRKAMVISYASIIIPIALGALLALWLYPRLGEGASRLGFTLFLGAAMAVTAFPVLARVLQETGLTNTKLGVLVITCAAVDDVAAWCVLAFVVALVEGTGFSDVAWTIFLSVVFLLILVQGVRPLLRRLPAVPLWACIALAMLGAWLTERIGIHAIFGAFMAGAVIPRRAEIQGPIKTTLEPATLTLLLPVFFAVVGLSTRIDLLDDPYLWAITAAVILTAIAGKWGGSMLAARATGEPWRDAAAIGVLMNTRGLTELVILTVGLELGIISPTLFTIMVIMALVTTLMATPILGLILTPKHRELQAGTDAGLETKVTTSD
jgi:K+:H+ antiporter